tara:strand:+ start:591 stop:896 length:306 start_codon:yes stop_codon:yes gene_type:complete
MSHKHLDQKFIEDFLSYNISKDDVSSIVKVFPEIKRLGGNTSLINGFVKARLKECYECNDNYISHVKELYELASNQRCQRGEPPIELSQFDPIKISYLCHF